MARNVPWFQRAEAVCPGNFAMSNSQKLFNKDKVQVSATTWLSSMYALSATRNVLAALTVSAVLRDDRNGRAVLGAYLGQAEVDAGGLQDALGDPESFTATIDSLSGAAASKLYDLSLKGGVQANTEAPAFEKLQAALAAMQDLQLEGDLTNDAFVLKQRQFGSKHNRTNPFGNMWLPWLGVTGLGPVFDLVPLALQAAREVTGKSQRLYYNSFDFYEDSCTALVHSEPLCIPPESLLIAVGPLCGDAECGTAGVTFGEVCAGASVGEDAIYGGMLDINAYLYPVPALLPFNHLRLDVPLMGALLQMAATAASTAPAMYAAVGFLDSLSAPALSATQDNGGFISPPLPPASLPTQLGQVVGGASLTPMCGDNAVCPEGAIGVSIHLPQSGTELLPPASPALPGVSWLAAVSTNLTLAAGQKAMAALGAGYAMQGVAKLSLKAWLTSQQRASGPASHMEQLAMLGDLQLTLANSGAVRGQMGMLLDSAGGGAGVREIWTPAGGLSLAAATYAQASSRTFASAAPDTATWIKQVSSGPSLLSVQLALNGEDFSYLRNVEVAALPTDSNARSALQDVCNEFQGAGFGGFSCDGIESWLEASFEDQAREVLYPNRNALDDTATVTSGTTSTTSNVPGAGPAAYRQAHWLVKGPDPHSTRSFALTNGDGVVWDAGLQVVGAPCTSWGSRECLRWMVPGATSIWAWTQFVEVRVSTPSCAQGNMPPTSPLVAMSDALTSWYSQEGSNVPPSHRVSTANCTSVDPTTCMVLRGRPAKLAFALNNRWPNGQWVGNCSYLLEVAPADQAGFATPIAPCSGVSGTAEWQDCIAGQLTGSGTLLSSGLVPTTLTASIPAPAPSATPTVTPTPTPTASPPQTPPPTPSASPSAAVSAMPTPPVVSPQSTLTPTPSSGTAAAAKSPQPALSGGAIAGIVVGAILVLAIGVAAALYFTGALSGFMSPKSPVPNTAQPATIVMSPLAGTDMATG